MKRDAIDLSTLNVFTLFRKYFVPTLLGMLSICLLYTSPSPRDYAAYRMPSSA